MIRLNLIKILWPLLVVIGIAIVGRIVFGVLLPDLINRWRNHRRFVAGEKWRSDRELLQWLLGMKPAESEDYNTGLFYRLGFTTRAVGQSHDGGIDVIAEKDGIKSFIQCKKFITSEVTVGAVRDFYGSLADRIANGKGYFITTNKFTLEAEKFAEDKPIELVDGHDLIRYIRMVRKETLKPESVPNQTSSKCPQCGGNLIERSGKFGKFLGCSNYPKCHYTAKMT